MSGIGNLLWIIFGGWIQAFTWFLIGCLWSITIIGLPIGRQCFKFARLTLSPFGKTIEYGSGLGSLFLNILWLLFGGLPIAAEAALIGIAQCVTIIGIPFGLQSFKFAALALMPFGAKVRKV